MKIFGYFLVAFAAANQVRYERGCFTTCTKQFMRDAMECEKYDNDQEALKCDIEALKKFVKCGTSCCNNC